MKMKYLIIFGLLLFFIGQIQAANVEFSHQLHGEDGAGSVCADCHDGATSSDSAADNLLPTAAVCEGCHDLSDIGDVSTLLPVESVVSKFPHDIHATDDNCLVCHEGVDQKDAVTEKSHLPGQSECATCHASADFVEAPETCESCHSADMNFVPTTHIGDWSKSHGLAGAMDADACSHCHQSSYCENCHEGDNLDGETHPFNYVYTHGLRARANKDNCTTCHVDNAYCVECHQASLVTPLNHMGNWGSGEVHGKRAKYDLDYCQICHNAEFSSYGCDCHN